MSRNSMNSKQTQVSNDVIPAFLTPDHIINKRLKEEKAALAKANMPSITDIIEEKSISQNEEAISDFVIRESLHRAIEYSSLDLFMQPVVTLPQRHVDFYEFYGRLRTRPGIYLAAQDYMKMASEEHIISRLDTIFLTNCLKVIEKQRRRVSKPLSYFINIRPYSLRDHDFMHELSRIIAEYKDIAGSLILEMHYNSFVMLSPAEKKIIARLADIGCRFSLDHLNDIPTDFKYLRDNHVSFIKLNAQMIIESGKTEKGFAEILAKKNNLDVNGIDMIIEKIENEHDLIELLDYDIIHGQGFLFGRPDFQGVYVHSVA